MGCINSKFSSAIFLYPINNHFNLKVSNPLGTFVSILFAL